MHDGPFSRSQVHGQHDLHHNDDHHHALMRGHNRGPATQWQMPLGVDDVVAIDEAEQDIDLVEASFVEGFQGAKDPTSFLRLASIPFVGLTNEGHRLHLLRVETGIVADVGSVSPSFGGGAVLYDPIPAQLVQQRRDLAFVYHDGRDQRRLSFAEARRLSDQSAPAKIEFINEPATKG
jgi:hypothetical protein